MGRESACDYTREIFDFIEPALLEFPEPCPQILSIKVYSVESRGDFQCEIAILLKPGAELCAQILPVDRETFETVAGRFGAPTVGFLAISLVRLVAEKVGFDAVADLLHETRRQVRKTYREWWNRGICCKLDDVVLLMNEGSLITDEKLKCEIRGWRMDLNLDRENLITALTIRVKQASYSPQNLATFAMQSGTVTSLQPSAQIC